MTGDSCLHPIKGMMFERLMARASSVDAARRNAAEIRQALSVKEH
jgi:hypothetical protein